MAVFWLLHPPTTSLDRIELRLLFLFSLVTRENRSPVATFTPQCPLLSVHMSVRLFVCPCVCPAQIQAFWFDDKEAKKKKKKSSLKSNDGEGAADLLNPSEISLFQQADGQTGRQSWSCCTVSSGSVLPPGSTGASHSLDRSPGKKKKAEWERGGVWGSLVPGVPSLGAWEESEAPAPKSAHAWGVREGPNLSESERLLAHCYWSGQRLHATELVRRSLCVSVVGNMWTFLNKFADPFFQNCLEDSLCALWQQD